MWLSARTGGARLFSQYASAFGDVRTATQAVQLAPQDPDAHTLLGMLLGRQGDAAGAVVQLERASQLRPGDYYPWLELGMARDAAGDAAGAERALRESARLAPHYGQPAWQLGNVLLRLHRYDEAFRELRRAASSDSSFFPAVIELAWGVNPNPLAVRETLQPQTPFEHVLLARSFAKHGASAEAVTESRLAGETVQDHTHSLIKELIAKGAFSEAREIWIHDYKSGNPNRSETGLPVYDGGFENILEVDDPGFGWHVATNVPTIVPSLDPNNPFAGGKSLRIDYRGLSQPGADAISQLIVVAPRTHYRLHFATRLQEVVSGGLPVVVATDAVGPNTVLVESPALGSGTMPWRESTIDFTTSEQTKAVRVAVRRKACSSEPCPVFGSVWLDGFALEKP
jgi:tetratricopeptide (TPR) repeat protein